jgi:hypothetical protein
MNAMGSLGEVFGIECKGFPTYVHATLLYSSPLSPLGWSQFPTGHHEPSVYLLGGYTTTGSEGRIRLSVHQEMQQKQTERLT